MNIVFGTKKLDQSAARKAGSKEKYPELAVITVEGVKEAKKSRRILVNAKAAELLSLIAGDVQEIIFASVETGDVSERSVLVANKATVEGDSSEMVCYKTSKNAVSYEGGKAKAITSSHVCNEILTFLSKDDSTNQEFMLVAFDSDQVDSFTLSPVVMPEQVTMEDMNGNEVTGEDLQNSISDEIAKAEASNPVLQVELREVTNSSNDQDLSESDDSTLILKRSISLEEKAPTEWMEN